MRIQLSEEDRKKYDAPEWIEFEYGRWGLKLIDAMERAPIEEDGSGWAVEDLHNNVFHKVVDDKLDGDGNPVLGEDGRPVQEEQVRPRTLALVVLAWLAVRSLPGNRVRWNDFEVQPVGMTLDWSSGKAETQQEAEPGPSSD